MWLAVVACLITVAFAYKPVVCIRRFRYSRRTDILWICMHGFSYTADAGTYHDYDNISQWYALCGNGPPTLSKDPRCASGTDRCSARHQQRRGVYGAHVAAATTTH